MAKGKVFVAGQPLTATEVNAYLNAEVPKAGMSVNTSAIEIAYASGYSSGNIGTITAEREGKTLYLSGGAVKADSARYATGSYENVGSLNLVSLGINPAQIPRTLYGPAMGQGGSGCGFQLLSNGSLRLAWNGGGATGIIGPQWISVDGISIRLVNE